MNSQIRSYVPIFLLVFSFNTNMLFAIAPKQNEGIKENAIHYNPIIPDCIADPSVSFFDGTFYMYATTDIDEGLGRMGIPVVWKSTDFVNWSFEGNILPCIDWLKAYQFKDKDGKDRTGYFRYWAPGKALEKDGKYYLFPTIVKPDESLGTYVVVADKPEGPFRFAKGSGVYFNDSIQSKTETQPLIPDIDGEPFVDDDGSAYIVWRRRNASKLSADFLSLEGETVSIPTKFGGYSEGPVLFKRKDIYYYVYTLSGYANYCNGYMISRNSPLGPYEAPEGKNIFIHSNIRNNVWGPGHGNVFQMPGTGDFYFLYLEYGEGGTTRQVYANKMEFNADGTIVPMEPTETGVGFIGSHASEFNNLTSKCIVTASSVRDPKVSRAKIIRDPNVLTSFRVNTRDGEEVERTFTYDSRNAADNSNGTRWWAKDDDEHPWFQVDLGDAHNVSKVDMYFIFPTFGHAWTIEKSMDGEVWEVCSTQKDVKIASPQIVQNIGNTRYLRINIIEGRAGLYELKVFGE